jgi:hypothetical protein
MVFAGCYPMSGAEYEELSDAIHKLQLSDTSLTVSKESSLALGLGFRVGFLGALHMEVCESESESARAREREREAWRGHGLGAGDSLAVSVQPRCHSAAVPGPRRARSRRLIL